MLISDSRESPKYIGLHNGDPFFGLSPVHHDKIFAGHELQLNTWHHVEFAVGDGSMNGGATSTLCNATQSNACMPCASHNVVHCAHQLIVSSSGVTCRPLGT